MLPSSVLFDVLDLSTHSIHEWESPMQTMNYEISLILFILAQCLWL